MAVLLAILYSISAAFSVCCLTEGITAEDAVNIMKAIENVKRCLKVSKALQRDPDNESKMEAFHKDCAVFLEKLGLTDREVRILQETGRRQKVKEKEMQEQSMEDEVKTTKQSILISNELQPTEEQYTESKTDDPVQQQEKLEPHQQGEHQIAQPQLHYEIFGMARHDLQQNLQNFEILQQFQEPGIQFPAINPDLFQHDNAEGNILHNVQPQLQFHYQLIQPNIPLHQQHAVPQLQQQQMNPTEAQNIYNVEMDPVFQQLAAIQQHTAHHVPLNIAPNNQNNREILHHADINPHVGIPPNLNAFQSPDHHHIQNIQYPNLVNQVQQYPNNPVFQQQTFGENFQQPNILQQHSNPDFSAPHHNQFSSSNINLNIPQPDHRKRNLYDEL